MPAIQHCSSLIIALCSPFSSLQAAARAADEAKRIADERAARRAARGDDDSSDDEPSATQAAKAVLEGSSTVRRISIPAAPTGPPRKKLSCVLFADNTHVLLTGDSQGHVDVYRVVGIGGGSDGEAASTSGPAAEGSEEWERQMEALNAVLASLRV
jgi:hypothetical protein